MIYGLHALTRPALRLANQAVGTAAGLVGVVAVLGMATALALPRISLKPALR